ncbi:MAG TPA: hypothetical protein VIK59_10330 [Verrucomicrobiae bacterium]
MFLMHHGQQLYLPIKNHLAQLIRGYQRASDNIESQNVPIDFYGKFVDQDSNALADVKIRISIRHWTMPDIAVPLAGSKEIYLEQTSDEGGRFEFHGETGDAVYIESIEKDGYELEPRGRNYGVVEGSFENPVVFKMWSTNIHEQLITGNKSFNIVPDGRPYFIDLTTDTINESGKGDLKVWIQYTNQVVHGQLYDWSAGIEVINGGLRSSDSYAMYEAPTDGYVPSFLSKQQIKGGQSGEIGDHKFYLLLKNGQEYGQMNINLFAPYGYLSPGLVHLSYAINPSGSRILR